MEISELSVGAHELYLFIENEGKLYRLHMGIKKNLALKKAKGIYEIEKARKAFSILTRDGADRYAKEFGVRGARGVKMFPVEDRRQVDAVLEEIFRDEHANGAFETVLPQKYQKRATKTATHDAVTKLAKTRESMR